jgi:hypothetical protein
MPIFEELKQSMHNAEVFSGTDDLFVEGKMHEVKKKSRLVYNILGTMGMNLTVGNK